MTTTQAARGLRGDYHPENNPFDLTGNRHIALLADKDERLVAQAHTVAALKEGSVTVIPEKGGAPWLIPDALIEVLRPLFAKELI